MEIFWIFDVFPLEAIFFSNPVQRCGHRIRFSGSASAYMGSSSEKFQISNKHEVLSSNLCRIFRLRGIHKMFWGSNFSRVERNFTIGQSPKIWGNFSKIGIKINKNLQNYWENSRKCNYSEIF